MASVATRAILWGCLLLALAALGPAGAVSYRDRGLLRLLFKHGLPQQARSASFYADLRQELLQRARGGRRLLAALEGVQLAALDGVTGIDVLEAPSEPAAGLLLQALQAHPEMEFAEADVPLRAFSSAEPDDPDLPQQWAMFTLGLFDAANGTVSAASAALPRAWARTSGSRNITVCVIDSGIDYTHPDLQGNLWVNEGEIANNGVDDDGNGFVDDYYGYNFLNGTGNPMDDNYHGTHLSGVVGARAGNGLGVAGVSPRVRVMGCKFLDARGNGYTSDAIRCMAYALQMGAQITLNSYGGAGANSQSLQNAIDNAAAAGQLFVTAAGNDYGWDLDSKAVYPASYGNANMLTVAATDQNGALADYSNYGARSTHIAAPGSSILSTVPGNAYGYNIDGMATTIKETLLQSAARSPALANATLSGGVLDVAAAMALVPVAGSLLRPPAAQEAAEAPAAPSPPQRSEGGVSVGGGGGSRAANGTVTKAAANTTTETSVGALQQQQQQLPAKPDGRPSPVQLLLPLSSSGGPAAQGASLALLHEGLAGFSACSQPLTQLPNPPRYGTDATAAAASPAGALIDLPGPVGVRDLEAWRVAAFANGSLHLLAAGAPPAAGQQPAPQPLVLAAAPAGAGFSLGAEARVGHFQRPDRLVVSWEGVAWGGSGGTLQAELFLRPGRLPAGSLRMSWLPTSGSVPPGQLAVAVADSSLPLPANASAAAAPAACLLPPQLWLQPAALPEVRAALGAAIPAVSVGVSNAGNATLRVAAEVQPGGRELLRPALWLNPATGYTQSFAQSALTCQQYAPDTDPACQSFPGGGGLSLRGAALEAPLRLAGSLAPPFQLRAGVQRSGQCSNQVLALSAQPQPPRYFGEPGSLWLALLCGKKYLWTAGGSLVSEEACSDFGPNSLDVRVGSTAVQFLDDSCAPMAVAHRLPPGERLHLFLGSLCAYADCTEGSRWDSLQLVSLGEASWRLLPPAPAPAPAALRAQSLQIGR